MSSSPNQKRPQGGGILPSNILKSLDELVDRINDGCHVTASSSSAATTPVSTSATSSTPAAANGSSSSSSTGGSSTFPLLVLLVGTNEGIPLSRSYGTIYNPQQSFISDEVLSSIETIWATLPCATPPHVKNSMALFRRENNPNNTNINPNHDGPNNHIKQSSKQSKQMHPNSNQPKGKDPEPATLSPTIIQDPPHPLLSQLGLGSHVRTTLAFYDHWTLIHIHMSPIVVTLLASSDPNTNIGAIKLLAVPFLQNLLEPVQKAILRLRYKFLHGGIASGEQMMMHHMVPHGDPALGYYHG